MVSQKLQSGLNPRILSVHIRIKLRECDALLVQMIVFNWRLVLAQYPCVLLFCRSSTRMSCIRSASA